MNFEESFNSHNHFLMEGALGERLKREYHLSSDENVALANLIYTTQGKSALSALWEQYIEIAKRYGLPFIATTPTRRANRERVVKANSPSSIIADNVAFLRSIQKNANINEMYIGGLMGCKGDAYTGEGALTKDEASVFHDWQANSFLEAGVDFLFAGIMPTLSEANGIAEAMSNTQIPYIISFTLQRNGTLIDGTILSDAIQVIDSTVKHRPLCYMANCVHPTIVYDALSQPFNHNKVVQTRFLGIQANTSPLTYAELDNSDDLKCSEPSSFANDLTILIKNHHLKIVGGCCGTDHRHMEAIASQLTGRN